MRLFFVCAAAGAISLMHVGVAGAFCRTTTVHEPVPYNPVESGCWTEGKPLAWAAGAHVPYSLSASASKQISSTDATRIAALAFAAWNSAECGDAGEGVLPNVEAYDNGPVSAEAAADDCGIVPCDSSVHDPIHFIVFDDSTWPFNDPNNTLALTTVTYGVDSGDIVDADIQINSFGHKMTAQEPPPTGFYDLQAILTHEAGHFLGLAHATSSAPIMFAQYQPGATTLTADDREGICAIYPPSPPSSSSSGCSVSPAGPFSGPGAALLLPLLAACRLRWRRRKTTADAHSRKR